MAQILPTPQGEVAVRLATPEDAAPLRVLRLEALSLHPEAFAADVEMTAAEGADVWAKRIAEYASSESAAISIASAGGQLIGMAGIGRGHWPKTRHNSTLWGVYVKPEWRGLRIAEALIHETFAWAQEHGLNVVYLGVIASNEAAIRCYARSGFTRYGVQPRVIFYDGIYYDEVLMAKLF